MNEKHSTSSNKRRSPARPGYSHIERENNFSDNHSHHKLINSNDDGHRNDHRHHGSSQHYNNDHRSYDRSSRNRHRSSRTSRDNSTNKLKERSESPDSLHHSKREEYRHKHGGNCRKSKRDRSHHHHQHSRKRSPKESDHDGKRRRHHDHHSHHFHDGHRSSRSRSHDDDEIRTKPKESKFVTDTGSKHSVIESNKSDIRKLVDPPIQIPTATDSKPQKATATVLASVAAAMASIKAQQPSESVLNRISTHQPTSLQPTEIPKYYNAKMVNAARLAQQAEKRKLLWGDNKSENIADNINQRMDES
ncbi:hypothetical protein BLA29_002891 [Euroglyphus maynei]|uniref:Uncharacterized protein n=1 Tax=Euroglyphus maynei TaxID=6958 RepID=A0A1Y3B887_EURMA|nr:hypothetical protein BLA29_002891 [Euroglyphus maynei]